MPDIKDVVKIAIERLRKYNYLSDLLGIINEELSGATAHAGSRALLEFVKARQDKWRGVVNDIEAVVKSLEDGSADVTISNSKSAVMAVVRRGGMRLDIEQMKYGSSVLVIINPYGINGYVDVEDELGIDTTPLKASIFADPDLVLQPRDAALALTLTPGRHPININKVTLSESGVSVFINVRREEPVSTTPSNDSLPLYLIGVLLRGRTRVNASFATTSKGLRLVHLSFSLYVTMDEATWLPNALRSAGIGVGSTWGGKGDFTYMDIPRKHARNFLNYIITGLPKSVINALNDFNPRNWLVMKQAAEALRLL